MTASLNGKVIAVTGAGRGIGRAVARLAAAEGASVVVADHGGAVSARAEPSPLVAEEVAGEICAAGGRAVACSEDVSAMSGGRRIVEAALDQYGRIDGMVCCAGIMVTKYLWELEEKEWDDVIAVHVKGHFSCFQAAARAMIPQGSGSLVAISSAAAINAPPNLTAYCTAKAAILGLTFSTANALARHGISTNCVMPNASTRMSDSYFGSVDCLSDQVGETLRASLAEGTYRDPALMAPVIAYLLSDAARDINGQVFQARGNEVQRLSPLNWGHTMASPEPWDIGTLAARLPQELGPDLKPPPIPWPEKA